MQTRQIKRRQLAARLAQDRVSVLGEFFQVVQQVNVQELGRQLLREARLHAEIELSVAEPEDTMALVVVDQRAVVELRGAQAHGVVGGGGEHEKVLVTQETTHNLFIGRRQWTETRLFRRVVQPLGELFQFPGSHQLTQVSVHRGGQTCEILSPIDAAGLQFLRKVRSGAAEGLCRLHNGGRHG